MKKKIAILSMIILMMAISASAKEVTDIKGWNAALWGMTEADLMNSFKGKITDTGDRKSLDGRTYRNLEIEKYDIDGVEFKVLFEMGVSDKKLKRVRLVTNSALASYFSQFEQLLTNKYGQPKSKDNSQDRMSTDKTAAWLLPSTKIELLYSYTRGLGSILNIIYSDKSFIKDTTDKL